MIELLKKAGLGYRTGDADVVDRIGDIPLRELVYRVHPLPPSLKPLIWDFGSMDNNTGIVEIPLYFVQQGSPCKFYIVINILLMETLFPEKQYIRLIIKSSLSGDSVNVNESYMLGLVDIISGCQDTLRGRTDQCSFVSLRDVNRFIQVSSFLS
jgi:hypothetical protein